MTELPFTVPRLAERWECSEGLIRKMIERGQLRSFRLGVLIRIPADEVERIECQSLTPSNDSGEGTPLSGATIQESDAAANSAPKIGRAPRRRHAGFGPVATVHRGPWEG